MLKSKKFKALCLAVAVVLTVPVFAFAASDGWTNVWLSTGRGARELALAPHNNANVNHAAVKVTKCDPGSMWLRVYDHGTFDSVTGEEHCAAGHSVDINYATKIASGRWLQLQGGADNALYDGYSSGSCNFG